MILNWAFKRYKKTNICFKLKTFRKAHFLNQWRKPWALRWRILIDLVRTSIYLLISKLEWKSDKKSFISEILFVQSYCFLDDHILYPYVLYMYFVFTVWFGVCRLFQTRHNNDNKTKMQSKLKSGCNIRKEEIRDIHVHCCRYNICRFFVA